MFFDGSQTHFFSTRSRFYRYGNRSGKFLLNLLKDPHSPTIIDHHKWLMGTDGISTSVGAEISRILHSFYAKLYARPPADETAWTLFWNNIRLPQISPEQADSLIRPITVDEVRNVSKQLKTNEFYKILGLKMEDSLVAVFNTFLDGSALPLYFNLALLKVLHKAGCDPELPASYRPISLLNYYKLYTKILAERLKCILPSVIYTDQAGFIHGRHSVTNVRKVLTVMQ